MPERPKVNTGDSGRGRLGSVRREANDPLALRASIGGTPEIGYYLVYRGDPDEVLAMLRAVVEQAEALHAEHGIGAIYRARDN